MGKVDSVCIIDDDKIYRFTTEKYIQMLQLAKRVTTYGDGEEAINYLKNNLSDAKKLPDIIFLDVNMPIMDGWDFLEEYGKIKSAFPKNITIYMISSSIDDRDRERAQQIQDISGYLVKPISEEELVRLVKKEMV